MKYLETNYGENLGGELARAHDDVIGLMKPSSGGGVYEEQIFEICANGWRV